MTDNNQSISITADDLFALTSAIRILIVESNPVTEVLQQFFTRCGCQVDMVATTAVLKQVKKQHYTVIFMDVDLTDAKGIPIAYKIRTQLNKNQETPIIGFNACL